MTNSGHTMGQVFFPKRPWIASDLEPALSDWTVAGARTYLISMRDDDGFEKA